ncbi:conserved hypothetical protein [Ricinus communis]|uniref:Uncharacterized protein n=1 Tax=Ricinus communis TaxID=3988 RepID=B9RRI8_RICCO|nr:conserved hypothetical protein [Ricinus communis]
MEEASKNHHGYNFIRVRGTHHLKGFCATYSLDGIFLMETKNVSKKVKKILKVCGFSNIITSDLVGRANGITLDKLGGSSHGRRKIQELQNFTSELKVFILGLSINSPGIIEGRGMITFK